MKAFSSALFALALGAASVPAVVPDVSFRFEPREFSGDSTVMVVHASIPDGWYVQSNVPLDEFLIPTSLRTEGAGLAFGEPVFPAHVVKDIEILGGRVALFQGDIEVRVPVRRKSARVSSAALEKSDVVLRYQACDNSQCLAPREVKAAYRENGDLGIGNWE